MEKTIEEYTYYTDGRIYSHKKKRFLKGNDYGGYNYVLINGKIVKRHRILAIVFLPIPEEYKYIPFELLDVHHKNGNSLDNRVCNLEWKPRDKHRIEHKSIPIEMLSLDLKHEAYFESATEASKCLSIGRSSINNNLCGRSKGVFVKGSKHIFRYRQ